jgi:hypothetical protein
MIRPYQMAEKITGQRYSKHLTKAELHEIMKEFELKAGCGVDWGYTHFFSAVGGFTDGYRAFITTVLSESELDPIEQIERCKRYFRSINATAYCDPENAQMVAFLRKYMRVGNWQKTPQSVLAGIDIMRMLMRPGMGEPRFYMLLDDEGCELLAKRISRYHWKLEADGRIGNKPTDKDDDEIDACRYFCMNMGLTASRQNS